MQASSTTTTAASVTRIVASFALLATLSACGYKGPLYLPPPAPPEESLTRPPESSFNAAPEAPAATSGVVTDPATAAPARGPIDSTAPTPNAN